MEFPFRPKPAGASPKGEAVAESVTPSTQSGMFAAKLGTPTWRKFVANRAFAESNRGAIDAENEYTDQVARENAPARRADESLEEKFGGDNGKLFRKVGRNIEPLDPEQFADDPKVGPYARKTLFDRERRKALKDAEDLDFRLRDPSLRVNQLSPKERADAETELGMIGDSPDYAEQAAAIRERIRKDDEVRKMEQEAFNAKGRARELESADPDQWWESRRNQLSAAVPDARALQQAADVADDSAAREMREIESRLATGVTGTELDSAKSRMTELADARKQIADARRAGEEQVVAAQEKSRAVVSSGVVAARDEIVKSITGLNMLPSFAAAMTVAKDKQLEKRDGKWVGPQMGQEASDDANMAVKAVSGLSNVLQSGLSRVGLQSDALDGELRRIQKSLGLSNDEMKAAWGDLNAQYRKWEEGEVTRVQSNGDILLNPGASDILDTAKATALIERSGGSAESKRRAIANLPAIQTEIAASKLEAYAAAAATLEFARDANPAGAVGGAVVGDFISPEVWAKQNGRKDFGSPQFIIDYEREVVNSKSWVRQKIQGLAIDAQQGNMKLASTLAGLAGVAGSSAAGALGAETTEASGMAERGQYGTGLVGKVVEELPSLATQMGIGRTAGVIGSAITGTARGGQIAGSIASISAAGAQSAGATFASEIAGGASEEDARRNAVMSGLNTAIITGIFQVGGMGGVEKVAAGKPIGSITLADVMASASKEEFKKNVRRFAIDVLKSSGGEAAEEGIDELTNAFITADPESNLSDAWANALEAAKVGGFIGGVVDVASKAIEGRSVPVPSKGERVTAAVAAEMPDAPPPTEEEVRAAESITPEDSGAADIADGVLIERELAEVVSAEESALADAEQAVIDAQATGDKTLVKAAEGALEKLQTAGPSAPRVRAVLKIAGGQALADLTDAEARSLGFTTDGKPLPATDLKTVGLTKPLVRAGADGSAVLLDEALSMIEKVSPRARGRVKLTEAEALAKAKERAEAANQEWDVELADGGTVRVRAADETAAEEEAAATATGRIVQGTARKVSGEPATQKQVADGVVDGQKQVGDSQKQGVGSVDDGQKQGAGGQKQGVDGQPRPKGEASALTAARKRITKIKKSPALRDLINDVASPDARASTTDAGIVINPERIVNEAMAGGMKPTQAAEYFARVLDEEVRHFAHLQSARKLWEEAGSPGTLEEWRAAHYGSIWNEDFVGTGKDKIVRDLYAKDATKRKDLKKFDSLPDWQKAMEGIRMMSQGDKVTEQAKLWLNISEKLRSALQAALDALKSLIADIDSLPSLKAEITNLENALREITSSKNSGNRPAKPPQGKAGDGARPKPGKPRAETPNNGRVEPGAGGGTGVAVGDRVEFDRNGERLTGVVDLMRGDVLRVKLDAPDSENVPTRMVRADVVTVLAGPKEMKGEKIDKEWVAFSPESGSLGIPRDMMPQIKSENRGAMVNFLNARGVAHAADEVAAASLKPTQLEYSPAKVAKAKAFEGGNRSILISSDGHIVDGHHQWMAALEKGENIAVIRLDAPIRDLLPMVLEMPSTETAGGANESKPPETLNPAPEIKGEEFAQKEYAKRKAKLKKLVKAEAWQEVIDEADDALAYFEKTGFPDDWSRWEREKESAEQKLRPTSLVAPILKPLVSPALSEADQALLDTMDGLFASELPDTFTTAVPPDRIAPLVAVATKYIAEGVNTPESLAERLGVLADGRMRKFSQSIWFGFKMAGTPGAAEPDWASIYGGIDNSGAKADGVTDDSAPQSSLGGQSPQAGDRVEPGTQGSVDSIAGGALNRPDDQEQQSDNGETTDSGGDSGAVGGNASRPGSASDEAGGGSGPGSRGGAQPGNAGTGSGNAGDGSGVVGSEQPTHSPGRTGYRLTDPETILGSKGPKDRFARNRKALETYDKVFSEGRDPTPEELDSLAAYIGWGSFGQELFQGSWDRPNPKNEWEKESEWLRDHLGKEGWESIRDSIINAHYTDPPHVKALWDIVQHLGFQGGRTLEPSMGIGNFFGLMPDIIRSKSSLTGIELDRVVGGMAKMLYPDANIRIMGYEKSATADNFYDLVIGNWPFAKDGPSDPRYNHLGLSLHDYFFVKALDQVRPGGLVIGITSSGTMDKKGQVARRQMAKRAELVGAFRFPTGAFKGYAGTSVVTDVLVLKKRAEQLSDAAEEDWIGTERIGEEGRSFNANLYWKNNPDHVLGEMTFGSGTTFGRAGMIVNRPDNYEELLSGITSKLPADIYSDTRPVAERKVFQNRQEGAPQNSVVREKGDEVNPEGFYIVRGEQLQPLGNLFRWELKDEAKTAKRAEELKSLLEIREQVRALLDSQRNNSTDAESLRANALKSYQAFAKKHGGIGNSFMITALDKAGDPMALTLRNLERKEGKKYVPRDILLKDIMRRQVVDAKGSIEDAYALQRNESTTLDLERIAEMSGSTTQEVIDRLLELNQIYMTPSGVWEVGEEYLGGNVRRKLREAKDAKEQGFEMDRNIAALEKIQPADVAYFEIEVQMGASWISREDYLGYVSYLLGADPANAEQNFTLVKGSSGWNFKVNNSVLGRSANAQEKWGVSQLPFAKIFQAAMNGTQVKVWYPKDEDGRVELNEDATKIANGKIDSIREELAEWLWSDPERTGRLSNDYNEVMNSEVTPKRDGSHLRLEGLTLSLGKSEFDFREHQKNAVWRFIMDGKGVGAHEVGTGKTFTMAGLAVEGRRLGKFRKTLIFAHNANSQAVYEEFQMAYPNGKFLYINNLSPENRDASLRQIALDEWDAVIVPHSLVDRFSLSEASLMEVANKQIIALENEIAEALNDIGYEGELDLDDSKAVAQALKYVKDSYTAKELVKQRLKIVKRIKDKAAKSQADGAILFEELGVDNIIVDEAHVFKKINLATRKDIKGLNKTESGIGWQMGALTDYVKSRNGGKGVYLFTGTPLTNNLNEAFNMMRFVMDEEMADTGIDNFDDWFNSFAAAVSDVELTTGGTHEPVTRLLSFVNVPELARLAGRYFDVVLAKDMPEFKDRTSPDGMTEDPVGRPFRSIKTVISEMSPQQRAHKEEIRQQYIAYQALDGKGKRLAMQLGQPTPITMEGKGTASALDYRLVDPDAPDYSGSKVNLMIGNAVTHYNEHPESTQMIFMERGFNDYTDRMDAIRGPGGMPIYDDDGQMRRQKVRHRQFNLARDIVEKLIAQGVAPEEIAILSNMSLDTIESRPNDPLRKVLRVSAKLTKAEIASLANEGKVRFMIGGTETMGTGVNAQRNLRAMHHLDAPWTPGALEQRNGRGWRQGNRWNTVNEYRYFAEGSHDGRRWQVLLNKVRFIYRFTQMLLNAGGESNLRVLSGDGADMSEGGSSVADFEQSFSAAAGDPRLLLKAKLTADVDKLERRRDTHFRSIEKARQSIAQIKREKASEKARLEKAGKVSDFFKETFSKTFEFEFLGVTYTERKKVEEAMSGIPMMTKADDKRVIGKYNGIELYFEWHPLRSDGDWAIRTKLADGRVHEISLGSQSLASMEGTMRGFMRNVSNSIERFGEYDKSIASLSEMLDKPFTRQPELDGKRKSLQMIQSELAKSPFPAPSWLRNGAPAGSLVYVNGEARDVGAHRWDKAGYWLLIESEGGLIPIDYRKVKDEAGNALFEERPFEPPPDAKELTEEEIRGVLGGEFFLASPDDAHASGDGWHVSGLFEDLGKWRIYNSDGDILGQGDTAVEAYQDYQVRGATEENGLADDPPMEGWLFDSPRYRKIEGRLIALRRLLPKAESKLERLEDMNIQRMSDEEEVAHEKNLLKARQLVKSIGQQIARFEREKMDDAKVGDPQPLRTSPLPRLRADSPEWKAMSKAERKAYLESRRGLEAGGLPTTPFYSQLQRTVAAKVPARATPEQIMATVKAAGVKAEEIKWSGIEQALGSLAVDGKVEKAALLKYLGEEGSVRFEEVTLGEVKFAQYVLPGGEKYREVVLAMPGNELDAASQKFFGMPFSELSGSRQQGMRERVASGFKGDSAYTSSHFPDVPNYVAHMRTNERDGGLFIEEIQSDRHQAGRKHGYREENQFQGTFTAKRDTEDNGVWEVYDGNGRFVTNVGLSKAPTPQQAIEEAKRRIREQPSHTSQKNAPPDAPFRTTWPLALFKRALRDAVASGKEWIGWTVGDTQNDRFDLSKQVDKIQVLPYPDYDDDNSRRSATVYMAGKRHALFLDDNAIVVATGGDSDLGQVIGKPLDEVLGKEVAQKIMDVPQDAYAGQTLSGLDLKVGGSGMKGFYDNMLPKEIGKYVKQWGGKVEKSAVDAGFKDEAGDETMEFRPESIERGRAGWTLVLSDGTNWGAWSREEDAKRGLKLWQDRYDGRQGTPIWRIDITPAMREGVSQGQALFAGDLPPAKETAANIESLRIDANKRIPRPLVNEARAQQAAFGTGAVGVPRLANPGDSRRSRDEQNVVDAIYEHRRQVREDRSVIAEARRRLEEDPAGVEEKIMQAAFGGMFSTDDADHIAARMLINQRAKEAGDDLAKHEANMALRMAYRLMRAETARMLRIGRDLYQSPIERHREMIADAIYAPTLKVEKKARETDWSPERRREFIRMESKKRIAKIDAAMKKMGVTIDEVLSGEAYLSLSQDTILKNALKQRSAEEQQVIKMHQRNTPLARIKKVTGVSEARIQEIVAKMYDEMLEQAREKVRAGLTLENYRDTLKGLETGALPGELTPEQEAEARRIVEIGFGLKREVATKATDRWKKEAEEKPEDEEARMQATAEKWIEKFATSQSDTLAWKPKAKKNINAMTALVKLHLRKGVPDFKERAIELGATEEQADILDKEIVEERRRVAAVKAARKKKIDPLTADWSRPIFTDGLESYTFETKDRAEIMARVEAIRGIAAATGKISTLTGKKRDEALKLLEELNGVLAKYGTNANDIFKSGTPADDYRFNIQDRYHVAAVARAISAIDADIVDKGVELIYSNILSGLQTMIVNATAIVPAAYETTVARGFESAVNALFRDPMAASFGESKYILRAVGPIIARAWTNSVATWGSELPMFDEDFLGKPADLSKLFDGTAPRIGSIGGPSFKYWTPWSGVKTTNVGRAIRVPTRLLLATDEFNRTALASLEVGAMAYRTAKASGLKPGTKEFDRFLRIEVNTPGSYSSKLAAQKASRMIFTNPLPGQRDPVTGKDVKVEGLGDVLGLAAAKVNETLTADVDNIFAKASLALVRVLFLPFQRTPLNILRKGARYTLNPISMIDIAALFAQNNLKLEDGKLQWKWNGENRNAEIIERVSQQLQGGLLMLMLYAAAVGEGDDDDLDKPFLITGSQPYNPRKRGLMEARARSGVGPYRISFRLNGQERFGFNYGRIEPLGTTLGITVDSLRMMRRSKDGDSIFLSVLGGMMAQTQEKTYLRGLSDMVRLGIDSVADENFQKNKEIARFAAGRMAMLMPNIIRQPIREADPNFRERADDFMTEFMYQVVPAGQKPPKRDLYGEVVEKTGTSLGRMVDFTDAGTSTVSPIDEALLRFAAANPSEAWFPSIITTQKFKDRRTGEEVQMTAAQLDRFREMTGKFVAALTKRASISTTNPTQKDIETIKAIISKARSDAKKLIAIKPN